MKPFSMSVIGTGQVAYHIARHAYQHGVKVKQILGRNLQKAQYIAQQVNAQVCQEYAQLDQCSLIIIAVKDEAIEQVMQQLTSYLTQQLVVHTSGSTDIHVLKQYYQHVGVFYPLQTFSFNREINWQQTPLLLETSIKSDHDKLTQFAQLFSSCLYNYSSAQRFALHLSAVIACNFSNFCYDLAKQWMDLHQVDYQLLSPLILETAQKAIHASPETVQTGPAKRQDQHIIQRHIEALRLLERQDMAALYQAISQMIIKRHHELG